MILIFVFSYLSPTFMIRKSSFPDYLDKDKDMKVLDLVGLIYLLWTAELFDVYPIEYNSVLTNPKSRWRDTEIFYKVL